MVVVTDHESRVLARRMFRQRAWELGVALDWAAARAAAAGFAGGDCRCRAGRSPLAGSRAAGGRARDLLECAWPAVLDAARQPFKSATWRAAVTVALSRAADGDPGRVTRFGPTGPPRTRPVTNGGRPTVGNGDFLSALNRH